MRGFLPVLKKEAVQMLRDRGTLGFALLIPAFQLALFGLIDTNVKHVRTVVFDQSRTQASRELVTDFVNTSYFDVVEQAPSRAALREAIVAGRASVGVEIPPDFARRRVNGQPADILVLIDGSDSSLSGQALAAANGMTLSRSLTELAARAGVKDLAIRTHPLLLFKIWRQGHQSDQLQSFAIVEGRNQSRQFLLDNSGLGFFVTQIYLNQHRQFFAFLFDAHPFEPPRQRH